MKNITVSIFIVPWKLEEWKQALDNCSNLLKSNTIAPLPDYFTHSNTQSRYSVREDDSMTCQLNIPIDTFIKFEKSYKVARLEASTE